MIIIATSLFSLCSLCSRCTMRQINKKRIKLFLLYIEKRCFGLFLACFFFILFRFCGKIPTKKQRLGYAKSKLAVIICVWWTQQIILFASANRRNNILIMCLSHSVRCNETTRRPCQSNSEVCNWFVEKNYKIIVHWFFSTP